MKQPRVDFLPSTGLHEEPELWYQQRPPAPVRLLGECRRIWAPPSSVTPARTRAQQGLPVRVELQNHCWTERVEAFGLLTVTSKGCSLHCVEDARNSFGSKKNTCCCTNLSNASGAHALQLAGITPELLAALGRRPLWGRAQL
ncbi:unnamed protein product [Rangifer tarandus platyrhynchus]|uniref:Uncharacterized protein n=1 Tax=Rangifer tarandus platyrhynchus TaxID=3082113 RepID=A0ABN8Y382_RANTA|nr:unnamed protein product [Rangifer tarandus platyrhynchus]